MRHCNAVSVGDRASRRPRDSRYAFTAVVRHALVRRHPAQGPIHAHVAHAGRQWATPYRNAPRNESRAAGRRLPPRHQSAAVRPLRRHHHGRDSGQDSPRATNFLLLGRLGTRHAFPIANPAAKPSAVPIQSSVLRYHRTGGSVPMITCSVVMRPTCAVTIAVASPVDVTDNTLSLATIASWRRGSTTIACFVRTTHVILPASNVTVVSPTAVMAKRTARSCACTRDHGASARIAPNSIARTRITRSAGSGP